MVLERVFTVRDGERTLTLLTVGGGLGMVKVILLTVDLLLTLDERTVFEVSEGLPTNVNASGFSSHNSCTLGFEMGITVGGSSGNIRRGRVLGAELIR